MNELENENPQEEAEAGDVEIEPILHESRGNTVTGTAGSVFATNAIWANAMAAIDVPTASSFNGASSSPDHWASARRYSLDEGNGI